jgi:methionyl-tRNA formyltransferase
VARIAVAATAPFGADVLERLAQQHDVALLLTRPDKPRGRGRTLQSTPAKEVAERLGIEVDQPSRLDDDIEIPTDTVVVAAYGLLIPEPLLSRGLWLNVHPSLLPRWRGAAPVERALMAGDTRTGVTIHRTTPELDAGPIAAQEAFDVGPDEDAGAVFSRSAEIAARLLDGVIAAPHFEPQPVDGITYAEKITPEDRELDLTRPARELVNRIRALSPHIGARAVVDGHPLIVWKARAGGNDELELLEVQPEGKRRMSYDEYRRGLR